MRIQTWSLRIQVHSDGSKSWDVVHSHYTKTGRQIPKHLAGGEVQDPADLHRRMDEIVDMALHSHLWSDGTVESPLW